MHRYTYVSHICIRAVTLEGAQASGVLLPHASAIHSIL